ncbi:DeoR/GlpR family DNA-binding transcription regulator [Gimesia panareensis]|nr:hypothetical protein [Gimesia panareensis]
MPNHLPAADVVAIAMSSSSKPDHLKECHECLLEVQALKSAISSFCPSQCTTNSIEDKLMMDNNHESNEVTANNEHEVVEYRAEEKKSVWQFALRQERFESEEKEFISSRVVKDAGLRDGEGVVLDAGSSCMAVWQQLKESIKRSSTLLDVYTNSFQILRDWEVSSRQSPSISATDVHILGTKLDSAHQAFFGDIAENLLKPANFEPSVIVLGTSGIRFDPNEGLLFGYHAGIQERAFKQLLMQVKTKKRFILASASKVGFTGAHRFDVLSLQDLDLSAPLILVSTHPKQEEDDDIKRRFDESFRMAKTPKMKDLFLRNRGTDCTVDFQWILLDPVSGQEVDRIRITNRENQAVGFSAHNDDSKNVAGIKTQSSY